MDPNAPGNNIIVTLTCSVPDVVQNQKPEQVRIQNRVVVHGMGTRQPRDFRRILGANNLKLHHAEYNIINHAIGFILNGSCDLPAV